MPELVIPERLKGKYAAVCAVVAERMIDDAWACLYKGAIEDIARLEDRLGRLRNPLIYTGAHYAQIEIPDHCPECDGCQFVSRGTKGLVCHTCWLTAELDKAEAQVAEANERFTAHTGHVGRFLTEMYQTMVDPLDEPELKVAEMCDLLLTQARQDRETLNRSPFNYPADWNQDSSLETWFPLTAEELSSLHAERDALKAQVAALSAPMSPDEKDSIYHVHGTQGVVAVREFLRYRTQRSADASPSLKQEFAALRERTASLPPLDVSALGRTPTYTDSSAVPSDDSQAPACAYGGGTGTATQPTAPVCSVCGAMMTRGQKRWWCLSCGNETAGAGEEKP
jgi:hypothetical protein